MYRNEAEWQIAVYHIHRTCGVFGYTLYLWILHKPPIVISLQLILHGTQWHQFISILTQIATFVIQFMNQIFKNALQIIVIICRKFQRLPIS